MQTSIARNTPWPYQVDGIPTLIKPKYAQPVTDSAYGALTEAIKRYVKDHPGVSQAEIREAMNVTPNAIVSVLTRMVARGHLFRVKDGHFYRYAISSTAIIGKRKARKTTSSLPVLDSVYEVPTKTKVVIDYEALFERMRQGPIVVRAHDISKWMYEALKSGHKVTRKQSFALVDGKRTRIWTVELKEPAI